jgi:flagellar basal-body rod protein FlgG
MPNGQVGYTRSGSFHHDSQGNIVTPDGNPLQPTITIPPSATNVSIGSDGTVTATMPGQAQASNLGVLQLATFPNPGGLNSVGKTSIFQPQHPEMRLLETLAVRTDLERSSRTLWSNRM